MMDDVSHHTFPEGLLADALPWVDDRLAQDGIRRTADPLPPRVRTWATTVAVPTDRGTVWFKAASHVTAHEVSLYPMLVSEAPDLVLHPIAIDVDRAWLLLPDGGTSLLHATSGDALVERLVEIMSAYAALQRAMAHHVHAMMSMGAPDRRPETLPLLFDEVIAWCETRLREGGSSEDRTAYERISATRSRYEEWCDILNRSPIPSTLDHSDLHANNILLPDGPMGRGRIYDWGDSVVGYPLSTLLVLLRALGDQIGAPITDPRLRRVRDAYLEPFTDLASRAELLELAELACWTSVVTRAMTWIQVLELGPPPDPAWAEAPLVWMKTLLNPSWFG